MESIELIRENLKRSEEIVLSRIEEMREFGFVTATSNGGCHTIWILGHLAYIESLVIRRFMLGETNPLAEWEKMFDGELISHRPGDFIGFDQALEKCRTVRTGTNSLLASYCEADLDRVSRGFPTGTENLFGTYRRCFQYAADHWLMHRGQLASARRIAGVGKMWF